MSLIATLVILGFLWREVRTVRNSEPAAIGWLVIGYAIAASLLFPLVAVWL